MKLLFVFILVLHIFSSRGEEGFLVETNASPLNIEHDLLPLKMQFKLKISLYFAKSVILELNLTVFILQGTIMMIMNMMMIMSMYMRTNMMTALMLMMMDIVRLMNMMTLETIQKKKILPPSLEKIQ